jgi:hypothetical protein
MELKFRPENQNQKLSTGEILESNPEFKDKVDANTFTPSDKIESEDQKFFLPKNIATLPPEEIVVKLVETYQGLESIDPSRLANMQLQEYQKFLQRFGFNFTKINDDDPTKKITGHSLKEWYDLSLKIATTNTDKEVNAPIFLNQVVVIPFLNEYKDKDKDVRVHFGEESKMYLDGYRMYTFNNIKSIVNPNFRLGFGSMHRLQYTKEEVEENRPRVYMAIFCIEPEIAKRLTLNKSSEKILQNLEQIAQLANHDSIAHFSFLPFGSTPQEALLLTTERGAELHDIYAERSSESDRLSDVDTFSGELLSLEWHKRLVAMVLDKSPLAQRVFRLHLRSALDQIDLLEKELSVTVDNKEAMETAQYMREAYAYFFFRIITPDTFANDPEWSEIRQKHPDFKPDATHYIMQEKTKDEFSKINLKEAYELLEASLTHRLKTD